MIDSLMKTSTSRQVRTATAAAAAAVAGVSYTANDQVVLRSTIQARRSASFD